MIGEYYDDSKILNNESRIDALTQELVRRLKLRRKKRKSMRFNSQSQIKDENQSHFNQRT